MDYFRHILIELKAYGFKLTNSRRQIVEAMSKINKPVSTYELHQAKSVQHIPAMTIHRTLDLLTTLGLLHKVHGSKYVKCTHPAEKGCHHFMICNDCGVSEEFIEKHAHKSPSKSFVATDHTFEINGFCKKCYK